VGWLVPLNIGTKCNIFHPKFNGKVVGKGIAGVNHAFKGFISNSLA
jgi:hypothetical protein